MGNERLKEEWIVDFSTTFAEQTGAVGIAEILQEMLRMGLANDSKVRDYLLIRDYSLFLCQNRGGVMDTVNQLSDKYRLSVRQVQNIIYGWKVKVFGRRNGMRRLTLHMEVI